MASWKNVQYKNGQYRTSESGGGGSSTLSGLDDVTISNASNGQVLKYNSTSSKWVNANETATSALSDLTDVDVDTKSDGDVLTYNEAQDRWEAAEPLGGGVNDVEVDGLSVVNDGVAEITTPDASKIEYDNQQSGLSATDVQSAIDELSQSTGVSTLNDLTDTAISSPSNNQVLTYDSSTSKWKNANATGGANSLNDLTDVDTTGVLDNNFLAYSSGQSKWVPATVSGGNVDDVTVNGTSVVTNKVAQIKSYKELTLAEYMALPDTKSTDDILYCIKDVGGANQFPPLIYSDEEREVGVWRDGKPLYQKTLTTTQSLALIQNTWVKTEFDKGSLDKIINISIVDGNGAFNSEFSAGFVDNKVAINCARAVSYVSGINIILQYTKTTDTPGSGTWTTDGTYAKHYSTEEKVIGTWVDGKPIYERTYSGLSVAVSSANSWYNTGITITNLGKIVQISGIDVYNQSFPLYGGINNYVNIVIGLASLLGSNSRTIETINLQYTKTTD